VSSDVRPQAGLPRDVAAERRWTMPRARLAEDRVVDIVLTLLLAGLTLVTLASAALLAVVHVDDRYQVNQASGAWLALAQDLHDGTLYRPFFEHGYYGWSGYMPLQVVGQAGLSFVTGEFLVSGKLFTYAVGALLLALVYVLVRKLGCGRLLALALVAMVVATPTGLLALTGIHGDSLPLLLQLSAVALVWRSTSRLSVSVAGALCALALLAKFTAVWAPLAIVIWLLMKHRQRLVAFLASSVVVGLSGLLIFELASSGRLTTNLREVFAGGGASSEGSLSGGVSTFFDLAVSRAGAAWLLFPIALLAIVSALSRRRPTLFQLSLAFAVPTVIVVLGNPGADFNQLIDFTVLTALVVAELVADRDVALLGRTAATTLVAVVLVLGIAQSFRVSMKSDVAQAVKVLAGRGSNGYAKEPLAGVVGRGDTLLSEDPSLPVILGERPVVLDSVGLRRLAARHPDWIARLTRRLDEGQFAKVVLIKPVEDEAYYRDISMGPAVRAAIARNYRLLVQKAAPPVPGYWVYVPKSPGA